jgi:beta-glucosidase
MHGHGILRFGLSAIFSKKIKPSQAGGNKKLHVPATVFVDGPRGVFHYQGATAFPTTMARGASWDTDLERRVGAAMGEEVRAIGGNYSGAVCMNLLRNPRWGRSQETYGEDPHHVGTMACALIDGIQSRNVQACAKHFAANSMENNRFGGSMNMDMRTLREVYLPHFHKVVQHGVASLMSAYNKINGEYCGHNKMLLTDILRSEWGFRGYITSDWANGLFDAQKGIEAGMNIEMPSGKIYKPGVIRHLIKDGRIRTQQIDSLIMPSLRTKILYASYPDTMQYNRSLIGCTDHAALAREVAEKSAVLLKNENSILPLDKNKIKRIAVIGSVCDVRETGDHGSSGVKPAYIITPLEGIRNYFKGQRVEVITAAMDDTIALRIICQRADVVIVAAGMTYRDEGEFIGNGQIRDRNDPDKRSLGTSLGLLELGGDRKYLHLHERDIRAIHIAASVNKNVVVSLVAGSAVTVEEWHTEVSGILETFYNGQEGGNALARILFGDVCPSGKLPFTVPKSESDLPPFNSFDSVVNYGYYHGYSLFDKGQKTPRYPFGYGLSYTSFDISQLVLHKAVLTAYDSVYASVKVKNTGTRAGGEVVQLYVYYPQTSIDMPEKLLRAFSKVYLQPGEERVVDLSAPVSDLTYYNVASNKMEILGGNYSIAVSNNSAAPTALRKSFVVR